jgi:hypothetical protein
MSLWRLANATRRAARLQSAAEDPDRHLRNRAKFDAAASGRVLADLAQLLSLTPGRHQAKEPRTAAGVLFVQEPPCFSLLIFRFIRLSFSASPTLAYRRVLRSSLLNLLAPLAVIRHDFATPVYFPPAESVSRGRLGVGFRRDLPKFRPAPLRLLQVRQRI